MKTKKALLPVLASALLLTMGLAACNNSTPASNPGTSSGEAEEVKIEITSEGGKKEIQVGETLQLTASVEGVTWSTKSTDIVSVSETGLVTAIKDGSARITAKKDGYANGSFTVTVLKAPDREPNYSLRLEEAEHYDPDDFWGMTWGGTVMGPGDSPVEDNGGKTDDGTSLGWLTQGCKETMTFTSNKAAKVEIGVTMAYNAEMNLDGVLSVKFNGKEISMAGRTVSGPSDGDTNNYYEFSTVSFGMVDLVAGNNVLEIEMLAQGPNMDKVVIFTTETLQIRSVPAQAKPKIEVVEAELEVQVDAEVSIQVKDNLAGVTFTSADEAIATVSTAGVVKGIKAGKTTIELTKEGYKKATVNITVKAKPVAGQVILEAEAGEIVGGRVENDNNSSGGARVGYLAADTSLTLKTTLEEAGEYTISMLAYSNNVSDWSTYPNVTADELDLSSCMTFKVNNVDVALTGKVLPAGPWGNYVEVSFGDFNLVKGENTFAFAFTAQGPNIDYIKLVDKNAPQGGDPVTPDPVVEKVTVSFDANGGTGTMAAVEVEKGEYTLPACSFTAPGTKDFGGWEYTAKTEFWGQVYEQQKVAQPGDKVTLTENITFKAVWNVHIEKTAQADLTSAFVMEAEDAVIAGAQTQQGGSPVETNESSHGGKDVGYMSAGASITFNFNASAAGQVKLILMGRSANADWSNWQNPTYYDHALEETTSIKANDADVDVTGKGFLGSDAKTSVQIDLGNIAVKAGANTIVVSALQQAPNIDCIALIADGITFTLPQA